MTILRTLDLLWGLLWLSCAAALQVQINPPHLYFPIGQSIISACRVVGDAEHIDWYNPRGEKILPDNPNISVRRVDQFISTLKISQATVDHAGFFKCVAKAAEQEAEGTLQLQLFQDITFTNAPSLQVFTEGDDADVVCDVHSSPPSEIVWRKEHKLFKGAEDERIKLLENGHLLIHNIKMADEGEYHCEARINSFGVLKSTRISVAINRRLRPEDSPPQIVEYPSDLIVSKGGPATLNCKAEGSPTPTIEWYKDGERVVTTMEDQRSHRLILPNGALFFLRIMHGHRRKSDEGVYVCVARNYLGEAVSRNATVEVIYRPKIQNQGTVYTGIGNPANISCEVEAHPAPVMSWFKDGRQLSDTNYNNRKIYNTLTASYLEVNPESLNDFGRYSCKATNSLGTDTKEFLLAQAEDITFTNAPSLQVFTEGDDADVVCDVHSSAPSEIVWRKEHKLFKGAEDARIKVLENGHLLIQNIKVADEGEYHCEARINSFGVLKSTRISVAINRTRQQPEDSPPRIMEHPTHFTVYRGEPATLNCQAEGSPTPTIEWYKDGERVEDGREDLRSHRLLLPSGELSLLRIMHGHRSKSDEGVYMCRARNYLGEAISRNATVEVIYPPKIQNQGTVYTGIGNPANISCEVEAHPAPVMSWFKDGIQLSDTNYNNRKIYNTLTASYLEIKPESLNDFGWYSCKASNSLGTDTKELLLGQVGTRHGPEVSPPRIVYHPFDRIVPRGEQATLNCKAEGRPFPVIEWYRDGERVDTQRDDPRSHRLLLPSGALFFLRIMHDHKSKSDEGVYVCKARNYLGEAVSRSATLEVTYPPKIQNQGIRYAMEGIPANISCEVEAHPAPEMRWFRDGLQLSDTNYNNMKIYNKLTASYLEVKPESPNDFGTYICKATNSLGTDTKEFNLTEIFEVPIPRLWYRVTSV